MYVYIYIPTHAPAGTRLLGGGGERYWASFIEVCNPLLMIVGGCGVVAYTYILQDVRDSNVPLWNHGQGKGMRLLNTAHLAGSKAVVGSA